MAVLFCGRLISFAREEDGSRYQKAEPVLLPAEKRGGNDSAAPEGRSNARLSFLAPLYPNDIMGPFGQIFDTYTAPFVKIPIPVGFSNMDIQALPAGQFSLHRLSVQGSVRDKVSTVDT